ncbi:MAG: hypothetical protein M1818_002372 [Claussenomyces sp. TS43310]|nr:MAG: hypothetical protein M1818_002372 [Claussenomyces sp. TS43310]
MTELSFAKSFLTTLDSRPTKLSPDHVEDPHGYPARGAYILPKLPKPMTKRQRLAPGQERSLNVTLKSLRNPPLEIVLKSQSPLVSILDVKGEVSAQTSIPVDKLRILHNKKPVGDAKVLKDLVGPEDAAVAFTVMVVGGAASVGAQERAAVDAPVAQGPSGTEVLAMEEFWDDLKAFLTQRLRDREVGEKTFETFKKAYAEHGSL